MTERSKRLTLDQCALYQIRVPGAIDFSHTDWIGSMSHAVEEAPEGSMTVLSGELDQAALHGLLRSLYAQGLPIISVQWIEREKAD